MRLNGWAYHGPIQFLKGWVADEAVVDGWYAGSPHEDEDAEVI